jgi:hypothetical protein
MRIYPENWTQPEVTEIVLTEEQRLAIKNMMKTYINNAGQPMLVSKLVDVAESYIYTNYSVHVKRKILGQIAIEIQEEWHPVVEEEVL